jgi:hypothetical protein
MWGAASFTFTGVPVERCQACGQIHISPDVAEKMQDLMKQHVRKAEEKVVETLTYA